MAVKGTKTQNYFAQPLTDIKGLQELLKDSEKYKDEEQLSALFYSGFDDRNQKKRNEILDHLLARFAESFGDYAFLMQKIYGEFADDAVLATKERFLSEYAKTSYSRSSAFNWYQQSETNLWDTDNISALQERLYLLLGITDIDRRNLSEDYIENKIEERIKAKKSGKYDLADKIREELLNAGILIEDEKGKTKWRYK